jgi:hypothetical protein
MVATNKNQHFVPRIHVKPFSLNDEAVAINLYNFDRERSIRNAPVKSQCSGDYFYGTDPNLEKAIVTMEGAYGTSCRRVASNGYQLTDDDAQTLRLFWLLQHLRTEAAAKRAAQLSRELADAMEASTFRVEIKAAVQLAMQTFADVVDEMDAAHF